MNPFHTARPSRAADAVHTALRTRGFDVEDFELEEASSSALGQLLGIVGGILKVRCTSTGDERIYSTGAGSAWLGAFLMDLGKGHFADSARSAGHEFLPMSQAVSQRMNA